MQSKKHSTWLLFMVPFLLGSFSIKKEKQDVFAEDWVGTISYSYIMVDKGEREESGVKSEWKYLRRAEITMNVKGNNKAYAYMSDRLDKWQQQISPYIKDVKAIQIITEKETGEGEGEVEVWVEMDKESGKYWLKTAGPMYNVSRRFKLWSNIIEMAGGQQKEDTSSRINDGIPIDAPDQSIGNNPNEISGSYVIFSSATHYTTVTWRLVNRNKIRGSVPNQGNSSSGNSSGSSSPNNNPRGNQTTSNQNATQPRHNLILVVDPESYETWKPAAGSPGNKEKISLRLQNNGQQSPLKAISFELKLLSTSRNGSLAGMLSDPPDIRFLAQKNALLSDDGLLIKIPCADGISGEVTIGSYNDKASSILIAEAILNTGMRVSGVLLQLGLTEIPIPKQEPASSKKD